MMVRLAATPVFPARCPGAFELLTVMTAGTFVAPPAQALTPVCPIVLDDTKAEGWEAAVSHAAARLAELASKNQVDCRSIEVHPNVKPPEVVFLTVDGRRAVRTILGPEELADAVDALAVTFTVKNETASATEAAEAPPAETPAAIPAPGTNPATAQPTPPPTVQPPVSDVRAPTSAVAPEPAPPLAVLAISGQVGFRAGQGTGSPVIIGQGTLGLSRFEVGVAVQWETGYVDLGEELGEHRTASGVGARLELGTRLLQRTPVSASAGLSLGAAALELARPESQTDDTLEGRLGAFAAARFPGAGPVGLRASVAGEWAPSGLQTSSYAELPSFAFMGTLGFEVEAL